MKLDQQKNKVNKTRGPKDFICIISNTTLSWNQPNNIKKKHFDDFNHFHDPKPFWKRCKPYFKNCSDRKR